MKTSKLLLTSLLAAATMSVPANADIYINFGSDGNTGDDGKAMDGNWNNTQNESGTVNDLIDFQTGVTTGASVTYSSKETWGYTRDVTANVLKCYLDDGNGVSITVSDVPYLVYSVNIYGVSDDTRYKLSYKTVNGVNYTKDASGNVVIGTDEWGEAQQTEINANNTLTVSGLTEDLSISSIRPNNGPRGCIAGIQIINTYTGTAYSATLGGDATWTASNLGSAAWTNSTTDAGTYADITLTADAVLTADAGIVTDGIIVGGAHTLTLANGASGSLTLSGLATLRASAGATLAFDTKQISRAEGVSSVTLVGSGTIAFTDANGAAAYRKIGTDFTAASNTTVKILGNANFGTDALSVSSGTREFAGGLTAGSANLTSAVLKLSCDATISGDVAVVSGNSSITGMGTINASGTLRVAGSYWSGTTANLSIGEALSQDGPSISVSSIEIENSWWRNETLTIESGTINVTKSDTTMGEDTAGVRIGLGQWGSGTLLLKGGSVVAKESHTTIGDTNNSGANGALNINGGVYSTRGVLLATISGYTAAINLAGGRLNIGTGGITENGDAGTRTFNFSGGTLGAFGDWSTSKAIALSNTATIDTLDSEDRVIARNITLNGVLSDATDATGSLMKTGAGTLTLGGVNTYSGGTTIEGGVLSAANADALGSGPVTVKSGATLARGIDGTVNVGSGGLTTEAGAILDLGTLGAESEAIAVTGNVSLDAGTIFNLSSVGTGKLISGTGLSAEGWSLANIYVGGKLINQRGSATFAVENNTLVLSAYTAGGVLDITWAGGEAGGEAGVWKENGSGWTKDSTAQTFQHGDSVTFGSDATMKNVSVVGALNTGTIEVNDNYTFAFADGASVSGTTLTVADGSTLTLSGTGTLAVTGHSATGSVALGADTTFTGLAGTDNSTSGFTDLTKVTGEGKIVFAAAGVTEPSTNDGAYSWVKLSDQFTGTLSITSGVVDMLATQGTDGNYSGIDTSRLGGTTLIELNGGGLLFRNVDNTTLSDKGSFTTAIEVGAAGGVIRVYGLGNVTLSGNISGTGTLTHTDGGTLKFSGNVDIGGFNQVGGTDPNNYPANTEFSGDSVRIGTLNVSGASATFSGASTTITTANISGGTMNFTGNTTIDTLTVSAGEVNLGGAGTVISDLRISAGKLTMNAGQATIKGSQSLVGNLEINNGATVYVAENDSLNYGGSNTITVNQGGVLSFGNYRWTVGQYNKIVINGGEISGAGEGSNGALDFYLTNTAAVTASAGSTSTISAAIRLRGVAATFTTNDGATLTLSGPINGAGTLVKAETGELVVSGTNVYTGGTIVNGGVLTVKNASALGTLAAGKSVSVANGAKLQISTSNVNLGNAGAGVVLERGAKLVIDYANLTATAESTATEKTFEIMTAAVFSIYGNTLSAGDVTSKMTDAWELLGGDSAWLDSAKWTLADNTLSLTLTIPEPSTFGLLAGLGALALAGTRRRRKKA